MPLTCIYVKLRNATSPARVRSWMMGRSSPARAAVMVKKNLPVPLGCNCRSGLPARILTPTTSMGVKVVGDLSSSRQSLESTPIWPSSTDNRSGYQQSFGHDPIFRRMSGSTRVHHSPPEQAR